MYWIIFLITSVILLILLFSVGSWMSVQASRMEAAAKALLVAASLPPPPPPPVPPLPSPPVVKEVPPPTPTFRLRTPR